MTAVAPPPPAPISPSHPRSRQHDGQPPCFDFANVLDRLPAPKGKEGAPAPKEKSISQAPPDPPAPAPAGAEPWAALLALSNLTALKPTTEPGSKIAPAPQPQAGPVDPKQPPPAPPVGAAPAAWARLIGARAFLAPSGAAPLSSAAAPLAEAFAAPPPADPPPAPAASAPDVTIAQPPAALAPQATAPRPATPARAPSPDSQALAKTEASSPPRASKPAAARPTAADPGGARKPEPTVDADGSNDSSAAQGASSNLDRTGGYADPGPVAGGLATLRWAPVAVPDDLPAPTGGAHAQAGPAPARVLSEARQTPAPVREIDVDLAPSGGLEDVTMTMRLQGERLSLVVRAASGQTASAIEGARDAIVERLAAIGQPLAGLVIERTNKSPDGNGTSDGYQGGERRQGGLDDPRGERRGASRRF